MEGGAGSGETSKQPSPGTDRNLAKVSAGFRQLATFSSRKTLPVDQGAEIRPATADIAMVPDRTGSAVIGPQRLSSRNNGCSSGTGLNLFDFGVTIGITRFETVTRCSGETSSRGNTGRSRSCCSPSPSALLEDTNQPCGMPLSDPTGGRRQDQTTIAPIRCGLISSVSPMCNPLSTTGFMHPHRGP